MGTSVRTFVLSSRLRAWGGGVALCKVRTVVMVTVLLRAVRREHIAQDMSAITIMVLEHNAFD